MYWFFQFRRQVDKKLMHVLTNVSGIGREIQFLRLILNKKGNKVNTLPWQLIKNNL
jgi:hypothetical protein